MKTYDPNHYRPRKDIVNHRHSRAIESFDSLTTIRLKREATVTPETTASSMSETPPANSVHPTSRAKWRHWLSKNHARREGIWLISNKKSSNKARVTYEDAVEEALCYGWIDSKPRKLDRDRSMVWMCPRKRGTGWSRLNKERIERLVGTGKMAAAGQAKIDAAKEDGSWTMLDAVEALEVPEDLTVALGKYASAMEHWEAFPRSAKKGILEWIMRAKRVETREKRVAEIARLAEENVRANQWRAAK